MEKQLRLGSPKVKYCSDSYNKFDDKEQHIRITDGCPNNCPFCYCPIEIKYFGIPEIVRNDVKIMDMNLLANPKSLMILEYLKNIKVDDKVVYYDFICGFDYRYVNLDMAQRIKDLRVKKIRLAWDWFYNDQYKIKDAVDCFKKVGYRSENIMIFIVCNWKIPYEECLRKLDLLKIWNLQVADCYYDNQKPPNIIPIFWSDNQNKLFRKKCRKHNQLVNFKVDPEIRQITKKSLNTDSNPLKQRD